MMVDIVNLHPQSSESPFPIATIQWTIWHAIDKIICTKYIIVQPFLLQAKNIEVKVPAFHSYYAVLVDCSTVSIACIVQKTWMVICVAADISSLIKSCCGLSLRFDLVFKC